MTALRKLWRAPNLTTKTYEGVLRRLVRHPASWASPFAVLVLILGLCACHPPKPIPPPALNVGVAPSTVAFGNVVVDTTVTVDVKVTTAAGASISVSISGAGFTETDNCAQPIFGVCHIQVSVTPTALGPLTGNLDVGAMQDTMHGLGQANLSAFGVQSGSALRITTTTLADGVVDAQYQQTIQTAGGTPPVTFSILSGSLPTGLTLDPSGIIVGTPTFAGTFSFTVKASDSSSPTQSASESFSITINPIGGPLSITTKSLPGGTIVAPYSATVQAVGGKLPYTFNLVGVLPGGLIMDTQGNITGTPSGPAGTATFTVTVKDSNNPPQTASQPLSITISGLAILPTALPDGFVGSPYTETLSPINGTGPFTWTETGPLPNGLALTQTQDGSSATISGTPTTAGTFTFSINLTDANGSVTGRTYTVTITNPGGNNNALVTGPQLVEFSGLLGGVTEVRYQAQYTADGQGGGSNVVFTSSVPGVNLTGATVSYTVDLNNNYTVTFNFPGTGAQPFVFTGVLDSSGNAGMILTSAPTGFFASGTARSYKQDPTAFSLGALQGARFFAIGGNFQSLPLVGSGLGTFDGSGNAPTASLDFAQPGSDSFAPGNASASVFSVDPQTGCGTGFFLAFVNAIDSFQNNTTVCIVNSHLAIGISPDQPSASTAGALGLTLDDGLGAVPPLVRAAVHRPAVSPSVSTSLSGAFTAHLQGFSGSGASATNSIQQAQFVTDGSGNITSGILDQNNGGIVTSSVNIAGSTITADATTPGRFTIHLNSNGKTLIDNDFTAYVAASGFGFIMAGTTAHPSTQLGFGILEPQTGAPFSASSFGTGCPVSSVPPAGAADTSLTGAMDFSAGITNFNSTFSFVQGGTVTTGQTITGTFTISDPNTGRFTGNLTGFPGTTGAVVGYLNGPNLFNFALSTSSTSSALVLCTGP